MAKFQQIAMAFPVIVGYEEEVVVGIEDFARQRGSWAILGGPSRSYVSLGQLRGWAGDGVIAMLTSRDEVRACRGLRVPIVNVSAALGKTPVPTVVSDQQAIGRLAAQELLRCEVRHFGFYGFKGLWYSQERCRGFVEELAKHGHRSSVLETTGTFGRKGDWRYWLDELRRWLKPITPPFGLMAVDDIRARIASDACRRLKLHVPHEVALIGVDNNRIACELSPPTLSSVAQNAREVGYRAAELLDRLMSGRRPPAGPVFVAPTGVITRESSDRMAVDDPDLHQVVRYIRQHISAPFTWEDMLQEVAVSRRWLEYRFRQRYGCSPHAYICEARLAKAKQLLLGAKDLDLSALAEACGFRSARGLRAVFQRITGMTPTEYRRANQLGS
jgi:LacI family transcriptional regulator